jgi:ADP-ribose pyrophosphatase
MWPLQRLPQAPGWRRVGRANALQVGYRTIVSKRFLLPDGVVRRFDTMDPEGTAIVAVIALTEGGRVVVARQFRPGPERLLEEIPGGVMDPGERDPQRAALRELAEETGYTAQAVVGLGSMPRGAYSNATHHYFLALGCRLTLVPRPEPDECIEVVLITPEKLLRNAREGRMTDGEAVFLARDRLIAPPPPPPPAPVRFAVAAWGPGLPGTAECFAGRAV